MMWVDWIGELGIEFYAIDAIDAVRFSPPPMTLFRFARGEVSIETRVSYCAVLDEYITDQERTFVHYRKAQRADHE